MNRNGSEPATGTRIAGRRMLTLLARVGIVALLMAASGCTGIRSATTPILSKSGAAPATQLSWLHSYHMADGLLVTGRIRAPLSLLRSLSGI
jgi:hypothetical protein